MTRSHGDALVHPEAEPAASRSAAAASARSGSTTLRHGVTRAAAPGEPGPASQPACAAVSRPSGASSTTAEAPAMTPTGTRPDLAAGRMARERPRRRGALASAEARPATTAREPPGPRRRKVRPAGQVRDPPGRRVLRGPLVEERLGEREHHGHHVRRGHR